MDVPFHRKVPIGLGIMDGITDKHDFTKNIPVGLRNNDIIIGIIKNIKK